MFLSSVSRISNKIRLCEIQKKKPVYVPRNPPQYEDLSRLVNAGKDSDTQELIKYIYQMMSDEGILYTLVNRLYEMRSIDIEFYVPELVYVGIKLCCKPILKFLIDTSQTSLRMFCLIYWNVQAFGFQMKDKSIEIRERLTHYEKSMVKAMVSSPHDIEMFGMNRAKLNFDFVKTIRTQHCQYFLRFINKLVRTSIDLKKIEEGIRKQRLKEEVTKANQSLKMWAAKYRSHKIKTHLGITIPFRRERYQNFCSTLMVGIIENECSCFNTKKRVPYRIVLQTIDPQDLDKFDSKSAKKSQKAESLMSSTVDVFLQDIPEVDYIPPIQIIKSVDQQEKFKRDFDNFVTQILKQQQQQLANNSNGLTGRLSLRGSVNNSPGSMSRKSSLRISGIGLRKKNTITRSRPTIDIYNIKETDSEILQDDHIKDKEAYKKNLQEFDTFFPQKDILIKRTQSSGNKNAIKDNRSKTPLLPRKKNDTLGVFDVQSTRLSERRIMRAERSEFLKDLTQKVDDPAKLQRLQQMANLLHPEIQDRQFDYQWVEQMTGIKKFGPWEQLWHDKVKRFKMASPWGQFPSYKLRNVIVKGGDDLRQEIVCMQVITKIRDIFANAGFRLYLRPYQIIVTSESSGILQFVTNGISLDELKKKNAQTFVSLYDFYQSIYGLKMHEAQRKFAESLAAYSILTYILQIKDRHNGNILIDYEGHIVHIDFGFIFCISPGGWNFESSPFKLTAQYVQLLQGEDSELYSYFKQLFFQGFNQLKKHVDQICNIVDMMSRDSDLPCFQQFNLNVFRDRFKAGHNDVKMRNYCDGLIQQSCCNWKTVQYDYFQYYTNQIAQ